MRTLLTNAIKECRHVHLFYEGRSRTVEPYLLGQSERGEHMFVGRQVSPWVPKEQSWQAFNLTLIYGLLVLDTSFKASAGLTAPPAYLLSELRLTA